MTPVYRGMDQETLDRQYNNRLTVADPNLHLARYAERSAAARARFPHVTGLRYGTHEAQTLDIFPVPQGGGAPVMIFVHGGAWQLLGKDDSAFPALSLAPAGIVVVALNFGLLPACRLDEIVRQVRDAVAWAHGHVRPYGGDPDRLYLAGHSSGAHLVGTLITTDWTAFGLPRDPVKGAVAISGIYDLEPVRLSYRNRLLQLDEAVVARLSPIRHVPPGPCPLHLGWAGGDTEEFKRQSREFAEHWQAAGGAVVCREYAERNHYDVIDALGEPEHPLARAAIHLCTTGTLSS